MALKKNRKENICMKTDCFSLGVRYTLVEKQNEIIKAVFEKPIIFVHLR